MNHTLIVPEFDPELQPIGYTLALEFLDEGGYADSSDERVLTSNHLRFRPGIFDRSLVREMFRRHFEPMVGIEPTAHRLQGHGSTVIRLPASGYAAQTGW